MSNPKPENFSILLDTTEQPFYFVKNNTVGNIQDSGVTQLSDGTWEIKTSLFRVWNESLFGDDGAAENGYTDNPFFMITNETFVPWDTQNVLTHAAFEDAYVRLVVGSGFTTQGIQLRSKGVRVN